MKEPHVEVVGPGEWDDVWEGHPEKDENHGGVLGRDDSIIIVIELIEFIKDRII